MAAWIWILIAIYFCIIAANSSLTFYGPTLVKEAGFTSPLVVGWIMAAAYLCGAAGMIFNGFHSDRRRESRFHCGLAAALGAASLVVVALMLKSSAAAVLGGLALAIVGTMSAIPVFWQMPNRFLAGTAAAGGVALINSIANLAGFGAPWMLGLIKTATGSLALAAQFVPFEALAQAKKYGADAMPHGTINDPRVFVSIDQSSVRTAPEIGVRRSACFTSSILKWRMNASMRFTQQSSRRAD